MGNTNAYVEGTAALKMPGRFSQEKPLLVAYPGYRQRPRRNQYANNKPSLRERLVLLADSSEMVCSLRYEGFRGVAYDRITPNQARAAGIVISAIGALAVILGA